MPQGSDNQIDLNPGRFPRRFILAGIGGAGMQAFCRMLVQSESEPPVSVIGTDIAEDQLCAVSIQLPDLHLERWHQDWQRLFTSDTCVVHSVAVPSESPVLQAARAAGCPVLPLPIALGSFVKGERQVCIAGTHGKTTTTGVISWILRQAGRERFQYVGGEFSAETPSFCGRSATSQRLEKMADWAVIESCEYRDSFLSLTPEVAVLTGIEHDHFDFFSSLEDQRTSFAKFVARCGSSASLVVNRDCPMAMDVAVGSGRRIVTFSTELESPDPAATGRNPPDWVLRPIADANTSPRRPIDGPLRPESPLIHDNFQQSVELLFHEHVVTRLRLRVPGRHNRQNVVAAIAATVECGVPVADAAKYAESFCGMKRRFEYRGHWNQVHWIDDYAHHPTAISETLLAAAQCFPNSRIIAVIEPHQISRLNSLFENYVKSLALAAEVLVLPVLAARETASPDDCQRLSGRLVRAISETGGHAMLAANLDQAIGRLDHAARPGDVVITMGAGRTHKIHDEIHRRLQRNSAA